ncbi:DUF2306 domain-containing protein [Streptomyces brasiliensis]|uniref:DUF2306 domain-containing protein n=1 Tax=Streptomyces brasiliensis TaxID=1954 RepID=A0A917KLW6_9ACTN|nr:DUF2306 domain-containing protein [Streptomyces brasiliensis]GGJ19961.1 hypothetical protein GCM10010121_033620 [Streptomyces brasiliensis]
MPRDPVRRWRRAALITVIVVSVAYAPVAMTELWPYADPGAPAFGEALLARLVSPSYVADALATRIGPYGRSLVPLVVHSVLGGLLMLLGPAQLLTAVHGRTRLHRALGVAYVLTVYGSMAGAGIYLARTAPADAFSGPAFWIVLATILVGTVLSVTFGVLAVLGGFPDLHQRWLLLSYGFLMTAPLLRLEWSALPLVLPGASMAEVNRVAIMHLGSLVAFGALLASRALDRRASVAGLTGSWAPWPVLVAAHLAGLAALGLIVSRSAEWGDARTHLLLGYLLPYAIVYAVLLHRSLTTRGWPREEWRIHLTAVCLAPVVSVALSVPFAAALSIDRPTALSAGVTVGCGITTFTAVLVVSLRTLHARETVRRASAGALVPSVVPERGSA